MKIVVTGGAGYIGSMLVSDLLNSGHNVTVIDNLMYNQTSLAHLVRNRNLDFVFKDIRNISEIRNYYSQADVIIPLAAIVGAPACLKDPVLASTTNKDAVAEMMKMLSKEQRVIMPTTNSAYGNSSEKYCDETSKLIPLSLYAKDKVAIEEIVLQHEQSTSLRLATVFGISPRMRLDLLVNNFVSRALKDKFIVVFEGSFKRNYIHILDVIQAFKLAIDLPEIFNGQIFNVGLSTANLSKIELCEQILKQIPDFVFFESEVGQDPDKRNYLVSNEKIEAAGFKPQVSLEQGISELIKGLPLFGQHLFSNV